MNRILNITRLMNTDSNQGTPESVKIVLDRDQVLKSDQWNVETLYPSIKDWEIDFTLWGGQKNEPHWPKLIDFQSKMNQIDPSVVLEILKYYFEVDRHLIKLYTYAHLKYDEDLGNDTHKEVYLRIVTRLHDFQRDTSWIEPRLLQCSPEQLNQFLEDESLKPFKFHLEKIIRQKDHTLDSSQEALLSSAALPLDSIHRAFEAFNSSDLKFPLVSDEEGKMHPLTHATYSTLLKSRDRTLRKNSFQTLYGTYGQWENTLCELIQGEVLKHHFNMKARKFKSCLEAALFPHNIDTKVYLNLISTVRQNLNSLHSYTTLRKTVLNLDELHLYDMHVSLIPEVQFEINYNQAVQLVINSVSPLGSNYQQILEAGLTRDGWVDRYENKRKKSGAYSSGCYDSMPYILMNYQDDLNGASTLAHEAGHSMHSWLSRESQPYYYSQYPIFVAEVASTLNEELLYRHLLSTLQDPRQKCYVLNHQIEGIRNTFFRQVMFAEFELEIHRRIELGTPLTPSLLKNIYRRLNMDYFGPSVVIDSEIDLEWVRIPHFYYNFYVYQYATGISAAHALMNRLLKEDRVSQYITFLSSGGSHFPIELLKEAGVDMTDSAPIVATIQLFDRLVKELKELLAHPSLSNSSIPLTNS